MTVLSEQELVEGDSSPTIAIGFLAGMGGILLIICLIDILTLTGHIPKTRYNPRMSRCYGKFR